MSQFLVITGMHRSNTSLLAQALSSLSVNLGDNLMGAAESNPYGHFEDYNFVRLHDDFLRINNSSWIPWVKQNYIIPDNLYKKGKNLFEYRINRVINPGFKDPRASLFLDYWLSIGKNRIKFILIFRHYQTVVFSLLKRMMNSVVIRPYYAINFMLSYCIYNECILEFYKKNSDQCYLIHNLDFLNDANTVLARLQEKLDLKINVELFNPSVIDHSIKSGKNQTISKLYSNVVYLHPRAHRIYHRLLEISKREQ